MQMYLVVYSVAHDDRTETGRVLVCAGNSDAANDAVRAHLDIPASRASFETSRVKPSVYQIDRRDTPLRADPARSVSTGTFPSGGAPRLMSEDERWVMENAWEKPDLFRFEVAAEVKAISEAEAMRLLAGALKAKSTNKPIHGHVHDLVIDCDRKGLAPRAPAIDNQSIFVAPRFFSGGAARGH